MSTTFDATVPEGLTELLEEFAISVLKERPKDLVQFAAHYFQNLHMSRQQTGGGGGSDISEQPVRMDVENGEAKCRLLDGVGPLSLYCD
jgi:hypothetical protein